MPITYTNRKGKTYTLCQIQTKKGRVRYYFSRQPEGKNVVAQIPPGYEVSENVNGQVSLRKIRPQRIAPKEVQAVERAMEKHPRARKHRLDVKSEHIIVYENPGDTEQIQSIFGSIIPLSKSRADALRAHEEQYSRFIPILRFTLVDANTRQFSICRMGYSGYGGWRHPSRRGTIEDLAKWSIPLLDSDAFFNI